MTSSATLHSFQAGLWADIPPQTHQTGVFDQKEYLGIVATMLSGVTNNAGDDVQSLTDASHDAWIKYYRKNENSINSLVTYYDKGAMIIQALNLLIMNETEGKRSFAEVMRQLWADYKAAPDAGYTEAQFKQTVEEIAGMNLDQFFAC